MTLTRRDLALGMMHILLKHRGKNHHILMMMLNSIQY